ncbi:biopolymer transporter ExbD [Candidatus Fermentibacteria bacterium]|nr:biopolymer transporter ExbD [Candidatus Fermentibacteria bacterium]
MRFRKRTPEGIELQIVSLIDVVFLLLIFFLMGTTFVDLLDKLDIRLPESTATTRQQRRNHLIELSVDGRMFLDGVTVTMEDLPLRLEQVSWDPGMGGRVAIIKADKRVTHGDVVRVMGICKKAGVLQVGIAALLEIEEEV